MEDYMKNYIHVALKNVYNQKIELSEVELSDVFEIQQLILDFTNLISYENNIALKNKKILKDAITKDLFFREKIIPKTIEYNTLTSKVRALNKLADGESLEVKNAQFTQNSSTPINDVYCKDDGNILNYYRILPFNDIDKEVIDANYIQLLQLRKGAYWKDNVLFVPLEDGSDEATIYLEGDKIKILNYNDFKNPFKKGHFRIFDANGEIKNLKKLDYTDIFKKIRNAESHHKIKLFANGQVYGGKIFPLGDGRTVLTSNRWHEFMINLSNSAYKGKTNEFQYIYVPRPAKSTRNDQDCEELINNCKHVKISTPEMCDVNVFNKRLYNILENYANISNSNISLENYLKNHLFKHYPNATFIVKNLENTEFLKRRLIGDTEFYNFHHKDKINATTQSQYIQNMVENVYGFECITKETIRSNGKLKELKVDLKDFSSYINSNLSYIHRLAKLTDNILYVPESKQEKFIALNAMCIYKNLIRNNFIDDIRYTHLTNFKGYVDSGKSAQLKKQLNELDMSMFEITNEKHKTSTEPKTLTEKLQVLRAVRNSVCHNCLHILYNKNCDLAESKFVFELKDYKNQKFRVNCEKFFEFINLPLFADYQSQNNKDFIIDYNDTKELEQKVIQLCKDINHLDIYDEDDEEMSK